MEDIIVEKLSDALSLDKASEHFKDYDINIDNFFNGKWEVSDEFEMDFTSIEDFSDTCESFGHYYHIFDDRGVSETDRMYSLEHDNPEFTDSLYGNAIVDEDDNVVAVWISED